MKRDMRNVIEVLKPRSSSVLPKNWYVIDTETNGLYGECWIICMMDKDGEKVCEFVGQQCDIQFREWFDINIKKFLKSKIYMFNAEFDFTKIFGNIYKYAMEGEVPHSVVWSNGFLKFVRREKVGVDKKGKDKFSTVQFIDIARNTYKSSLADIGDSMGLEKGVTPKKFINACVQNINSDDVDYCWLDCEITRQYLLWLEGFYTEFSTGMRLTTSANAKAVWQTSFLKAPIYLNHNFDEMFRDAYYGGRTEVFRNNIIDRVYYYDINSMYPANMVKDMPDPNTFRSRGARNYPDQETFEKVVREALKNKEGFVTCKMRAPAGLHIPLLPEKGEKLLFKKVVNGKWCFPEIRKALEVGYKFEHINQLLWADRMTSPFIDYIKYFSRMKETSKKRSLEYYTAKIMLNGLYGKMGERVEKSDDPRYIYLPRKNEEIWQDDGTRLKIRHKFAPSSFTDNGRRKHNCDEIYNDRLIAMITELFPRDAQWALRKNGFLYRRSEGDKRAQQTCVSFAAYITSYARVMLYDYLEINPEAVIYCDTDSMVTTQELPNYMVHPTKTGLMELVGEFTEWQSLAPKHYGYTDGNDFVCRVKGISSKISREFTGLYEIKVGSFEYDSPFKTHESIIRGAEAYSKKIVKKVVNPGVGAKRIFNDDGSSISR